MVGVKNTEKAGVQILSYQLMKKLSSSQRVKKVLDLVQSGDIVMMEGKLTPEEETTLISSALGNVSGKFTGIEIAYLDSQISNTLMEKIRHSLIKVLAKDRMGITVIGPSKKIKEIKLDPNKLEILFK